MKATVRTVLVSLATIAIILMFAPVAQATSFQIDPFGAPAGGQAISVKGVGSPVPSTVTGLAGVVGGSRTLGLNVTSSAYGLTSSLVVASSGVGSLSFNNDSDQDAIGTVTWDQDGLGLGGVDITLGGACLYLQATILASDLDLGFRVDITETVAAGGATAWWTTNLGAGPSAVLQPLSGFTNADAVDFTRVDRIVLTLSGPSAQDGTIDLLEITNNGVPEPTTIAGIILGLGALCGYIRRRMAVSSCGV